MSMKLRKLVSSILEGEVSDPFPEDMQSFLSGFIPDAVLKDEILQHTFEITDYEMERLYEEAYAAYQWDQFEKSTGLFRILVMLDPYRFRSWMGLGGSLQMQKSEDEALHAYAVAAFLRPQDAQPHRHAAECYHALGNEEEAESAQKAYLELCS